ncbi:MAG: NAD-dependent epimerase/dehydratase family protein [Opitutales bacterium]
MTGEGITLVTGGAGFIGRHVLQALRDRGAPVRVIDTREVPQNFPAGVDYHQGSILQEAALRAVFTGVTQVVHIAGVADLWLPTPQRFDAINHVGTCKVLQAAKQVGVRKFVHTSSETILRDRRDRSIELITPNGDLPPLEGMPGPYTRSKWQAEQRVREAAQAGFPAIIVYPTMPLGPGDDALTPPTRMLRDFLVKPPPAILDCALNAVDVRDVAEAMVHALELGETGERFILGGENLRLRVLLAYLHLAGGKPPPKRMIPYAIGWLSALVMEKLLAPLTKKPPAASLEGIRLARLNLWSDNAPACEKLDWSPRPVDVSVSDAAQWLREAGHLDNCK